MAKIIPLAEYKEQVALRAVGRYWDSLFEEPFDARIRLSDLRPKTLFYLAEPGDESSSTLYALIIGLFGFDETTTFKSLDSKMQNHILDIHLFISDQIRFEMMFRLGWLERFVGNHASLLKWSPRLFASTRYAGIDHHCWPRTMRIMKRMPN